MLVNKRTRQDAQKTYRDKQMNSGLVRYELQVRQESKERFEQLVSTAAEEYIEPWDKRRRMAKARVQIFDEITKDVMHDFYTLQDQISSLKNEVKTLSPDFSKSMSSNKTPVPKAITALPDDPTFLKELLAKTYTEKQEANKRLQESKRHVKQYEELYDAASEELRRRQN